MKLGGGLLWAALTVLCWAPMFPVAKRAMSAVDAFALGTLRYGFGVLLLMLILAWLEGAKALRYDGRFGQAAFAGLLGITGFNAFVWFGLMSTRPEHAAIIMALQSPMTAIAVWLLKGPRPARFTLACIAVAVLGVALVVTGAVAWVFFTLRSGRFHGWSPLRFTVLTCLPGGIGLALVNVGAVAVGIASVPSFEQVASIAWQLVYFVLGSVVLGILAFNQTVRHLGPLNTMLMLNLIPISVFAIEAALGRSYVWLEIAGAALVIGALVANNLYLRWGTSRST